MKLLSMRRLILTDMDELMTFIERTREHCGHMTFEEVVHFISHGRVEGFFLNAELAGVVFCTKTSGFCTDGMMFGITAGHEVRYLRVLHDECLATLLKPESDDCYTILHYRHIDRVMPLIGEIFELTALKGGIGNKPYLLLYSGAKSKIQSDCLLCSGSESKELSRYLAQGYRAIASMGNKLILAQ